MQGFHTRVPVPLAMLFVQADHFTPVTMRLASAHDRLISLGCTIALPLQFTTPGLAAALAGTALTAAPVKTTQVTAMTAVIERLRDMRAPETDGGCSPKGTVRPQVENLREAGVTTVVWLSY